MLALYIAVSAFVNARLWRTTERGQATAEYALVLLGAAAVALVIVAWATNSDKVGDLFDAVIDRLRGHVER